MCPTEPPQNKQNKDLLNLKQVLLYFLVAANFVGNIFLTIFLSENTRLSVLFMINIIYIRYQEEVFKSNIKSNKIYKVEVDFIFM